MVNRVVFLLAKFVMILMIGCASSRSQNVTLSYPKIKKEVNLYIIPFEPTEHEYKQAPKQGKAANTHGLSGQALSVVAKGIENTFWQSGIFIFNEDDIENLRESLVESLKNSQLYPNIIDGGDTQKRKIEKLQIVFHSTGQNKSSSRIFCWLKATLVLLDSSNNIIRTQLINMERGSKWTLARAKNDLIRAYLHEIYNFLQSEHQGVLEPSVFN